MKTALLNYDPMRWADNISSELENLLNSGQIDIEGAAELFDEGLITVEEFRYAQDFLIENERR